MNPYWRRTRETVIQHIDVDLFLEYHYADRLDTFVDKEEAFMWATDYISPKELAKMIDESGARYE